jgi:hypothetical protein
MGRQWAFCGINHSDMDRHFPFSPESPPNYTYQTLTR